MNDLVSRRNTEGVMQTIRRVEAMVVDQQVVINKFSDLVGGFMQRLEALERAEMERKIAAMGRGPTDASEDVA